MSSFPYMNAQVVAGMNNIVANEEWQLFSVPAVVDVSGMEFSLGIPVGAVLATSSYTTFLFTNAGSTGTASAQLLAGLENSSGTGTAWTANTPRDGAGTSITDLDADDWVAVEIAGALSTPSTGWTYQVAYIYGKPGVIN